MPAVIRPLRPGDVEAADRVAWDALRVGIPDEHVPDEAVRAPRGQARIAHLLATDPGGAWVAEAGGAVAGVALALVREGVWGLSLLAVAEAHRGDGVGRDLLAAALRHADGTHGGIILSSTHPAAMRAYARAGFALRPCVTLAGVLDRRGLPGGLTARPGDPDGDRATIDAAARHVRGASYGDDVRVMVERNGGELLVVEGRGFACHREGSPALLCALDEQAATDLLLSSLAGAPPGGSVHVDFVMAGHDWAIAAGLRCGLALSPEGPVFTRGQLGTLAPFLPSGAYL